MVTIYGTINSDTITPWFISPGVSDFPTIFADTIYALAGNDTVDGGAGADTMDGGDGNDTYYVDNVGDIVKEIYDDDPGGTADIVFSSVSYSLLPGTAGNKGFGIENLTLTGSANLNATGNSKANVLTGNSGINTLDGGLGADTMDGGDGNDTYYVDNVGDIVKEIYDDDLGGTADIVFSSVSYSLLPGTSGNQGYGIENLTLTGSANINATGNGKANVLTGNSGNNTLNGEAGNDIIYAGAGNDTVDGGDGNDTIYLQDGDDYLNIPTTSLGNDIFYGGNGNDSIWGGDGHETYYGEAGNDTLKGWFGDDTIVGGLGADNLNGEAGVDTLSYVGSNAAVTVNLTTNTASGGHATGDVLAANSFENLTGSSFNDNLTGNSGNNRIDGGAGNDVIQGGPGKDTLLGGTGNDTLVSGDGADTMTGGSGNDKFTYNAVATSSTAVANRDVITDFVGNGSLAGDQINLSAIDANAGVTGNQAFTYIGSANFTAAGQMRYSSGILQLNTSGTSGAEFEIQLSGAPSLFVSTNTTVTDVIL